MKVSMIFLPMPCHWIDFSLFANSCLTVKNLEMIANKTICMRKLFELMNRRNAKMICPSSHLKASVSLEKVGHDISYNFIYFCNFEPITSDFLSNIYTLLLKILLFKQVLAFNRLNNGVLINRHNWKSR